MCQLAPVTRSALKIIFHKAEAFSLFSRVLLRQCILRISPPSSEQGCAPFPKGIDALGFFRNIDQAEAQRYADVEITHGRVAMLAALGFYVGEQVEGSAFLFDASVTGPAINHFQQVPPFFAVSLGIGIVLSETIRVNVGLRGSFHSAPPRLIGGYFMCSPFRPPPQ